MTVCGPVDGASVSSDHHGSVMPPPPDIPRRRRHPSLASHQARHRRGACSGPHGLRQRVSEASEHPDDAEVACIEIAQAKQHTVSLTAPLTDREIVSVTLTTKSDRRCSFAAACDFGRGNEG